MISADAVLPQHELERLLDLSELDLDYSNYKDNFADLTRLAAKIAGTDVSLINLIDSYTQWSISSFGLEIEQMPREDSVCQYTILGDDHFEVEDLTADSRFSDKFYVVDEPHLRYYYGIPLTTHTGYNIGALCVLSRESTQVDPEKEELLKIIAREVVTRLVTLKQIDRLKSKLAEAEEIKRRVAHDIRGPVGGMMGLAQLITEQGQDNDMDEVLEFSSMIHKSGVTVLELADEILNTDLNHIHAATDGPNTPFTLNAFSQKLESLYKPQALPKNISFSVMVKPGNENMSISRNSLLQITGNLISNALKFTPANGRVNVQLGLTLEENNAVLFITVADSGVGMDKEKADQILYGHASTTTGTMGEQGFGFGLSVVKNLIEKMNGKLHINSTLGKGTEFVVELPVQQLYFEPQ